MQRPRHRFRAIPVVLACAGLMVAGCGGGDTPVPPPTGAAGTTPPAGSTTPGSTVSDSGAAPGATDPTTGQPIDAAATAPPATVPQLDGSDLGGSLGADSTDSLFDALALDPDDIEDDTAADSGDGGFDMSDPLSSLDGFEDTSPKPTTTATVDYRAATIYVDGTTHTVTKGTTFPEGDPVFRLVSVSAGEVEVELVAGEFTSDGASGLFLDKGDLVSLVNSSEGRTYRVKYLRPVAASGAGVSL